MATVRDYIVRMPQAYQYRYQGGYWVNWANALLERLSGAGVLPPQHVTAGVVPRLGVWIDKPQRCREVKELKRAENSHEALRFAEENGKLRLMDIRMPDPPERIRFDIAAELEDRIRIRGNVAAGFLVGWLFVVTRGDYEGRTFVVEGNSLTGTASGDASVFLRGWPPLEAEVLGTTPTRVQDGYFVHPRDYLTLSYVAEFIPVETTDDELHIGGMYENFADTWFRWKIEEQISALSDDCKYWGGRAQSELLQLRAEKFSRVNPARGRSLAGFAGNRRF